MNQTKFKSHKSHPYNTGNVFLSPSSTKEVHHDEMEDNVGKDEIGKCPLRTDSGELGLVGRINLARKKKVFFFGKTSLNV